jgi:hypothetical protein
MIEGEIAEGSMMMGSGNYSGGVEGKSIYKWLFSIHSCQSILSLVTIFLFLLFY